MGYAAAFGPDHESSLLEVVGLTIETRRTEAGLSRAATAASTGFPLESGR
jgi:hypothetical protein